MRGILSRVPWRQFPYRNGHQRVLGTDHRLVGRRRVRRGVELWLRLLVDLVVDLTPAQTGYSRTHSPRGGQNSDQQFYHRSQDERPNGGLHRRDRFQRWMGHTEPILPIGKLVEYDDQQEKARNGIDEQELSHSVDVDGEAVDQKRGR